MHATTSGVMFKRTVQYRSYSRCVREAVLLTNEHCDWRFYRSTNDGQLTNFYRAMHFSAKRGIAIACLSVCPSVRLSVTLVDYDHIGWNSSKIISPLVSLGCSLFATPT